ncbi:MAG: MerR family transcriptional regulator, partial [Actinobacteria bacterium]|nr:MerR family transcriptional regulator [Actinomycetota bacterium]
MSKHLTIAELSAETGLKPATLRAWENRHGFPRPL